MLRSAWTAQELLTTFNGTIAQVSLLPNHNGDGIFEVFVETEEAVSRAVKVATSDVQVTVTPDPDLDPNPDPDLKPITLNPDPNPKLEP